MRIHLPGLFGRHLLGKGKAAESLRTRRQGNEPHAQGAPSGARPNAGRLEDRRDRRPRPHRLPMLRVRRPRRRAAHASTRPQAVFLSRTRLNKPGSEKETWHVELDLSSTGIDYAVGDAFGVFPANHPALVDAVIRGARRPAGFSDRRPHRCATCCSMASRSAPRPTCCSSCSPTSPAASGGRRRRRSPPARIPTATPPRSTCSRPSRSSRRASRSGSLHRSARSAAAAALFHRLVAADRSPPHRAVRRCGALSRQRPRPPRRRLHVPRRARASRRPASRSMFRRRSISACRPIPRCRSS